MRTLCGLLQIEALEVRQRRLLDGNTTGHPPATTKTQVSPQHLFDSVVTHKCVVDLNPYLLSCPAGSLASRESTHLDWVQMSPALGQLLFSLEKRIVMGVAVLLVVCVGRDCRVSWVQIPSKVSLVYLTCPGCS